MEHLGLVQTLKDLLHSYKMDQAKRHYYLNLVLRAVTCSLHLRLLKTNIIYSCKMILILKDIPNGFIFAFKMAKEGLNINSISSIM
jgi:hypothetical protein